MLKTSSALTFAQMEALYQELLPLLKESILTSIYEVSERRWIFIFQKDSSFHSLLVCLEEPYLRFHLIQQKIKHKDPGSRLHARLAGSIVDKIELLNHDRILCFHLRLQDKTYRFIIEFFPKHPNYYLIDKEQHILFSLYPSHHPLYTLPSKKDFSQIDVPLLSNQEAEIYFRTQEQANEFKKAKADLSRLVEQKLARASQKKHMLEKEQLISQKWKIIQHEAELLKANFHALKRGMKTIIVLDWLEEANCTLSLDPLLTPAEEIAKRFKISKKLHAGISHIEEQLFKVQCTIDQLRQHLLTIQSFHTLSEIEQFQQQMGFQKRLIALPVKGKKAVLPYQEFESATGIKIWVGRSAKDNEKLTFSLARGSDWWLHVNSFPGSHVIIRTHKGQEPDYETLSDAIQLALYYSKAKSQGEGEICLTQRKFVSRSGKHSAGTVQISKHKTFFTRLDPERYKEIKERSKKSHV